MEAPQRLVFDHFLLLHWRGMKVEIEQEEDGRFIAEVPEIPGVMNYGTVPSGRKSVKPRDSLFLGRSDRPASSVRLALASRSVARAIPEGFNRLQRS